MKQSTAIGPAAALALSQTPPANTPPSARKRGPENLPWTRFHPATPPYQPTDSEKHQIQAKIGRCDDRRASLPRCGRQPWRGHRDLSPGRPLENGVTPKSFYASDRLRILCPYWTRGWSGRPQLKEGKSPWTTQKERVVRGYRSALDESVQPVRVTIPDEYDGARAFPLDVAQHG